MLISLHGQDELKWKDDVDRLISIDHGFKDGDDLFLFTGSSSIVMWKNIRDQFPDNKIINNGFGGSQMHELLYFLEELVINYKPAKVFIYEGDNDISEGRTTNNIMKSTKKITRIIKQKLPGTKIYYISPKPSIARWELKEQYISLNTRLNKYALKNKGVFFIDVWNPMLTEDGSLNSELFISDGLHMNQKGYEIWSKAVKPFVEN